MWEQNKRMWSNAEEAMAIHIEKGCFPAGLWSEELDKEIQWNTTCNASSCVSLSENQQMFTVLRQRTRSQCDGEEVLGAVAGREVRGKQAQPVHGAAS